MFLKSLQIQGFKSFPDKIKLDFEQGITCTVGPNGSGKSNISDAVRWVLGEQSPTALRIKSMEDVIFAGTDTHKASGFAEVIITIDNTARWLSPDTDEVSVTRKYYRSGTSEYKINGKIVRWMDINELFMDTGIGRDGYSMIGQGKIADIVDAKAHDRRVIFEEAAGISGFRHKKELTERNLAKTQENLTFLEVTLAGYEERVGPLEKESEKAKKYLELHDQYTKAEIGLWLHILNTSTEKQRDQQYNITLLDDQAHRLDEQAAALEEEAENLTQQQNVLTAQKDDTVRTASEKEEEAARLEGRAAVIENDRVHAQADIERMNSELSDSAKDREQLRKSVFEKRMAAAGRRKDIEKKNSEIDALKAQLEALHSDEEGKSKQLGGLYARQDTLTVEINAQRLNAAKASSQIEEITSRSSTVGDSIEQKRAQNQAISAELAEAVEALEAVRRRTAEASNTLSGYRLRLDRQRVKAEEAKKEADRLRLDTADKNRRAQLLEDLERNMGGYDHSVKAVMQRAEAGGLHGIHGPVSRVISVDSEYALAIETALGAAVKNIIVDTQNDGKLAMEFLKQTRQGRATFLPIDVIRPRSLNEKGFEKCEGFVNIASRLVRCDDQYRRIIENLLGHVCVAEDMDSAIAIARSYNNRFRIVTLDGQVINAGGSMTGGSQDKNVGLLTRRSETEELKKQAAALAQQAKQAAEEHMRIVKAAAADEAAVISSQSELALLGEDAARFDARIKALTAQSELASKELEQLMQEQSGAADRIASLTEQRIIAEDNAQRLQKELDGLTARITEDSGNIEQLSGERERIMTAINEANVALITLVKECEALEQQLEDMNRRIEGGSERDAELARQIESSTALIAELTAQADGLKAQASGMREQAARMRASVSDYEQRRAVYETQARDMRREAKAISEQREGLIIEKGKLEERFEQTRREQDSIILRLNDEYKLTRREAEAQYQPADNEEAAKRLVNSLRHKIRALGSVNVGAIEEYKEVLEKYNLYRTQIDDITKSKREMEDLIAQLTNTMREMFLDAFGKINQNFSEIFPELFGGGSAGMTLSDPEDCLNCGIDINIQQPSRTRGSNVSMSGGEKAIVAVAIYFAIMKVKPSPFCFLDEIDSALDEHNVVNIANYIKRFTGTTQYIVITHRRGMMEAAGMLYGVTKQRKDGISRLISLRLEDVEEKLGSLE